MQRDVKGVWYGKLEVNRQRSKDAVKIFEQHLPTQFYVQHQEANGFWRFKEANISLIETIKHLRK